MSTSRRARTRPSTFQITTRPTRPCFIDVLIEGPALPLLLQSLDPWPAMDPWGLPSGDCASSTAGPLLQPEQTIGHEVAGCVRPAPSASTPISAWLQS